MIDNLERKKKRINVNLLGKHKKEEKLALSPYELTTNIHNPDWYEPRVPHGLSVNLNMCIYALRHHPITSWFLRVSFAYGFITFGIRVNHHLE